MFLWTGIADSC